MVHEIKIGPRGDTKIQREKEREKERKIPKATHIIIKSPFLIKRSDL